MSNRSMRRNVKIPQKLSDEVSVSVSVYYGISTEAETSCSALLLAMMRWLSRMLFFQGFDIPPTNVIDLCLIFCRMCSHKDD
jgi:hypothetical protein